jgi:pimeloyl-ACP methyl ester carboxylesterase
MIRVNLFAVLGRKRLKKLFRLLCLAVGLWLLSSLAVAYWLTRRPHPIFEEPVPAISWGNVQPLRLTTGDGEELGAWSIAGQPDRPVVLLLHGYRGCRRDCLAQAELLAEVGCPSLLISLRAHGDSTGEFNDVGYSAQRDVIAAVGWLEDRYPGRPIIIWGQSMGAAAAVFAARSLGERVQGYILECLYKDLRTAVRNRLAIYLPLGLSSVAYAGMAVVTPLVLADVDSISPLEAAPAIPASVPVLVMAGSADRRATLAEAQAIHERIASHAHLVIIPGADHARLFQTDPATYREAVLGLIRTKANTMAPR